MSDTWVELPADTVQAITDHLEGLGWFIEHVDLSYIEVNFPDPDSGHAMRFSGWWLSWRLVDGRLLFGVGDDTMDLRWRAPLNVEADAAPEAVAEAANRVMHLLWHYEDRDCLRGMYEKNSLLSAMERRMQELGRRMLVTPGMIRDALKPSGRWTL